MNSYIRMLSILICLLSSCDTATRIKETVRKHATGLKADDNSGKTAEKFNKKVAMRRAKGDTLSMPYQMLARFLPASVPGYEPVGEPSGQIMNMQEMSYSTYEQSYHKDEQKTLKIELTDYNAAASLLQQALASALERRNDTPLPKPWNTGVADVSGYEEFQKPTKTARIVLNVADRFLIQISASDQLNTEFVKAVALSLKLDQLRSY